MSVYTAVDPAQLDDFLTHYALGKAENLNPIAAGITNSNYCLATETGEYVLTLYEHHSDDELDYILGLQQHLANHGVSCACPVSDRRGALYSNLNLRPAAIIHRIEGSVVAQPTIEHCRLIGKELAKFHLAGQEYAAFRENPRGIDWWLVMCDMLDSVLSTEDHKLLQTTVEDYRKIARDALPQGAIHADLFHDNVLFRDDDLGGIIDFDYACNDSFVFDIAIMLNDWCIDPQQKWIKPRVDAVLEGYQQLRQLLQVERLALPLMLRIAALRFWLSRLHDKTFPLSGQLTTIKYPDEYRKLLVMHSESPADF